MPTPFCGHDATIGQAAALGQRFLAMVRERQADALDGWLMDAEASGIIELRNLAKSLRRDQVAVYLALSSKLTVDRGGRSQDVSVTLQARPEQGG